MTTDLDRPEAPPHLEPATRAWWQTVAEAWNLEEHHLRLLTLASEAWDRAAQARQLLAVDGIVTRSRFGEVKAHPAIAIERDNRIAFARLVRELDLDLDGSGDDARPPRLRSVR